MAEINPPMAVKQFARLIGRTPPAVTKAIRTGRLRHSVIHVAGTAKIRDPELAQAEWEANTRPSVARHDGLPSGSRARVAPAPDESVATRAACLARLEAFARWWLEVTLDDLARTTTSEEARDSFDAHAQALAALGGNVPEVPATREAECELIDALLWNAGDAK
jgi:hypothetical protein